MAFWDWNRWQKEIDWMALHGINMPLAAVGTECVWRNMLLKLGYSEEEVGKFIAGPAFLAWWEMNNLEGWGGPLPLELVQAAGSPAEEDSCQNEGDGHETRLTGLLRNGASRCQRETGTERDGCR